MLLFRSLNDDSSWLNNTNTVEPCTCFPFWHIYQCKHTWNLVLLKCIRSLSCVERVFGKPSHWVQYFFMFSHRHFQGSAGEVQTRPQSTPRASQSYFLLSIKKKPNWPQMFSDLNVDCLRLTPSLEKWNIHLWK